MKKAITFFSIALSVATVNLVEAQTKTNNKLGVQSKLSAKDSMMCKEWKVVSVEEWAVKTTPKQGDKNFNDMLKLTPDGKFSLVLFDKAKSGTWTKAGQYIYFTDEATKEKFNYKLVSVEDKMLKVDYRDPDETHSIFEMVPKK